MTVHSPRGPTMPHPNQYKSNLRDLTFLLFEQFKLGDLLGKAPYANWGKDEVSAVLEEAYGWTQKHLGPYSRSGDEEGCRTLAVDEAHGGQAGPFTLAMMVEEFMCGSNTAFNMYPALTQGAADVILAFGTPEQQATYVPNMFNGRWAGTMCLTEPHAGSDVGSASSVATRRPDGKYDIRGVKIFISGGDQDMTESIVHMVLARTPDAPPGTKGL